MLSFQPFHLLLAFSFFFFFFFFFGFWPRFCPVPLTFRTLSHLAQPLTQHNTHASSGDSETPLFLFFSFHSFCSSLDHLFSFLFFSFCLLFLFSCCLNGTAARVCPLHATATSKIIITITSPTTATIHYWCIFQKLPHNNQSAKHTRRH